MRVRERGRVINIAQAVSYPLSWPECAFVTAAYSPCTAQSMTTCQAGTSSKPWHDQRFESRVDSVTADTHNTRRRPHTAGNEHVCSSAAVK